MCKTFTVILLFVALCPGQEKDSELFNWKIVDSIIGTLMVPKGYKLTSDYYGEGIFTTLAYKDSSVMFLHFGGDIKLPIVDGDINVNSQLNNYSVSCRKGTSGGKKLFWREDDYCSYLIHIGYSNVPAEHLDAFEKAIDSFKRKLNE
jgi:hypothetical protein